MKLSVIIVNYNVRFFLEQCLRSVYRSVDFALKADPSYSIDVFVVDNNSSDDSVEMVRQQFPEVRLIANSDNPGFSKANNQAIRQSNAEHVLLLNPDTVVREDTFEKVLRFMDERPDVGGLGIKMIDGKGNFLPESKRGLPTPMTAFYKIFGLSSVFPKSRVFSRYHMGHLSKDETHEVEILSGTFMLMRKSVLDKVGLLDEDYFMYGEDIDLSYRIILAGHENVYFADSEIIHYKGESTKKGSLNYVFVFYQAMIIFAKKHFSSRNAALYSLLINSAIYFRAALAVIRRFFDRVALLLFDALLLYGGMQYQKEYWENNHRYVDGGGYPPEYDYIYMPIYIVLWLFGMFWAGGYDKPVKLSKIIRGLVGGSVAILVGYSLLPESLRTSRALILLGSIWAIIGIPVSRMLFHALGVKGFAFENDVKRMVMVGSSEEVGRVRRSFGRFEVNQHWIGFVSTSVIANRKENDRYLGTIERLDDIVRAFKIEELIFCGADLSNGEIMDIMERLSRPGVEYRIVPKGVDFMIGSQNIRTADDQIAGDLNTLLRNPIKRIKRLFDLATSAIILALSPVLVFFNGPRLWSNVLQVLVGQRSWVGLADIDSVGLLPKGVLDVRHGISAEVEVSNEMARRLNYLYAKEYSIWTDLNIVLRNWAKLGRRSEG